MPMYKKPLCILLGIALIVSIAIFYQEEERASLPLEETSASLDEPMQVTVYVSGEVNRPGVVDLTSTSRVSDAIKACGDFTAAADKASVNLAKKVEDGMQIKVLALEAPLDNPKANSTNSTAKSSGDMININTADESELDKLPGIGPAMAKRIIEYRQTNGNFQTIEDIKNVSGIGEAKFNKMQDKLSL